MSDSGPIPRSQTRPTSIAIPAGSSSYDVMLYSDGSDIASEQGMQKVRLKLQDWNVFQFGWQEVESVASWQDVIVGQKDVATSYEIGVGLVGDFLWGALAGSDNLDAGLAGDMTISLIPVVGVYTDIRDLGKQIWYSSGLSNKQFSSWEASLAALGIVAELFPPADYFVDGARFATKILKNGRAPAQVTAVLTAITPLMLDGIEELWNRATSATPQSPSSSPSNNNSRPAGTGSGEGAGGSFWNEFKDVLIGGLPAGKAKTAGKLIMAIANNDPDFMEGVGKLSARAGKRASKNLEDLITGLDGGFESAVSKAMKLSKLPNGGGDEAFAKGLMGLAQSLSGTNAKKLVEGLKGASPDEIANLIIKMGKTFAAGDITDPRAAKALTNIFDTFAGGTGKQSPMYLATILFDSAAKSADDIAGGATTIAEKTASKKALQGTMNGIANQHSPTYKYGAIHGAIYELFDFANNSLPSKKLNARIGSGNIVQETDSLGKRMVGGQSKTVAREAMLFGENPAAKTIERKTKQFLRYKENQLSGNMDIIEYAMPDQASIDRFIKKVYLKAGFNSAAQMKSEPYLRFIVNPMPLS